ncbi:MAG: aldehyde dehydrogenase family protein [Phycisphaerales bacterium]|nr:aldehyde dehydrogenase family protein [Phycisphaerales bacterium]
MSAPPSTHPSLSRPPSNLVGGTWIPLNPGALKSASPAEPARVVYAGESRPGDVNVAIEAARAALPAWSAWPRERRFALLRRFQSLASAASAKAAALIADETGKALWDSTAEAGLIGAKVDITLDAAPGAALGRVTDFEVPVAPTRRGVCTFRPHGVVAVLGPFNFPMHLPNGHIIPALAMGNTVVFKPSDKAPACGQLLVELLDEACRAEGAPPGVINLVQGDVDIARSLVSHGDPDAILFTGSWAAGRAIMQANLDRPGRILALEMGGNNAAVVMPDADLRQALIECVRSAFVSTGQRCTCTRRLVLHRAIAPGFMSALVRAADALRVGPPLATPPVFMGPIISREAREGVLAFQARAERAGARVALRAEPVETAEGGWYLSPGVLEVPGFVARGAADAPFHPGCDEEVFGPLLRVTVVDSIDAALRQANATRFGLAASIFTGDSAAASRFQREARAGCVNVNTGTAGASSKLPFGGLGLSGNHRPAGAFSLDYCAYPVAGLIEAGDAAPLPPGMTVDRAWLPG